jgi:6-phosphogluconolactonase
MRINIFKAEHELLLAIALYFIKIAKETIAEQGAFNVALSGGNSPKKLYKLLSTDEFEDQVDWSKVNVFFVDERYVPADDAQNNSLMIQNALFEPLKMSASQIFRIDTTLTPDDAAKKYNETIVAHVKQIPVRFDFMLLGLGDNAHTASLFPFTCVLAETYATVKAVFLKEQNSYRITMTAPMINEAKHIAFLVYGKEKAQAVYHVLKDVRNPEKYPGQLIHPAGGELQWFLDEDAAVLLESPRLRLPARSRFGTGMP